MDCSMFSRRIRDACISLRTATDIARFGFIVQDSVPYLDLKLSTDSRISNLFGLFCYSCRPKRFTNFVNTEEKCRLFFAPRRRLLYTLNLDLPKERECSLKIGVPNSFYCMGGCNIPHVGEINAIHEFHADCLSDFIRDELITDKPKEKILKLIAKSPFSELNLLSGLDASITRKLIDSFYPEVTDSELLKTFIRQFDILKYMRNYEEPEILEFLLHQARLHGNITLEGVIGNDLINECIFNSFYLNIGPVLKYIGDFRPADSDYDVYLTRITLERLDLAKNVRDMAAEKSITGSRLCLLMQVIWTYLDSLSGLQEASSEALRLMWRSVPDPFLTYEEFKVFETLINDEGLTNMFNLYVNALGELHEHVEPRSLQHLCRTALRRIFVKNNLWIPDGIRRMGFPTPLRSFLNLGEALTA